MKIQDCKLGMKCKSNNNPLAFKYNHVYTIIQINANGTVNTEMQDGTIHEQVYPEYLDCFEAPIEAETITISKALYDRFMNLFNEVDYQINHHYDNRANLTIERDNVKRMLDKEVTP